MLFLISVHLATGAENTGLKKSNYHQPIKSPDKKAYKYQRDCLFFKDNQSNKAHTNA